jgi:hypothetical protein
MSKSTRNKRVKGSRGIKPSLPCQLIGWKLDVSTKKPTKTAVSLKPIGLKCNTAIMAQPGYGKSFVLRRLIEEVLSKSYANFLIFDSNADFIRLSEVNADVWKNPVTKSWLGHGNSYENFVRRWGNIEFHLLSNRSKLPVLSHSQANIFPIGVNWSELTIDDRIDYLGFSLTGSSQAAGVTRLLSEFVSKNVMTYGEVYCKDTLETFKNLARRVWLGKHDEKITDLPLDLPEELNQGNISAEVSSAVHERAHTLWQLDIWNQKDAGDSLQQQIQKLIDISPTRRVRVIDLPSLSHRQEQFIVCHSALTSLWRKARERDSQHFSESKNFSPTFIVIDEAHKLLPLNPQNHHAKQFVDVVLDYATEGRKYGLYLILITQRPSLLDPRFLSLCDNLCLLRITNKNDLDLLARSFAGFPDSWQDHVMNLNVGQALFCGSCVSDSIFVFVAHVRTIEGGTNISDNEWLKDPLRI